MPKKKEQPKPIVQAVHIKKEAMLKALEKSLGVVTMACKMSETPRQTHYDWMEADTEYRKKVDTIQDVALDFAESQLHKQIEAGIPTSTIFYLKTKGKSRGYIEKTEQDVKIEGSVNLSGISADDLRKFIQNTNSENE